MAVKSLYTLNVTNVSLDQKGVSISNHRKVNSSLVSPTRLVKFVPKVSYSKPRVLCSRKEDQTATLHKVQWR